MWGCSSNGGAICAADRETPVGGGGKLVKEGDHLDGASPFAISLDTDFTDDMLLGDVCSVFRGDTAIPISPGGIDARQKLLLFSCGAPEALNL